MKVPPNEWLSTCSSGHGCFIADHFCPKAMDVALTVCFCTICNARGGSPLFQFLFVAGVWNLQGLAKVPAELCVSCELYKAVLQTDKYLNRVRGIWSMWSLHSAQLHKFISVLLHCSASPELSSEGRFQRILCSGFWNWCFLPKVTNNLFLGFTVPKFLKLV